MAGSGCAFWNGGNRSELCETRNTWRVCSFGLDFSPRRILKSEGCRRPQASGQIGAIVGFLLLTDSFADEIGPSSRSNAFLRRRRNGDRPPIAICTHHQPRASPATTFHSTRYTVSLFCNCTAPYTEGRSLPRVPHRLSFRHRTPRKALPFTRGHPHQRRHQVLELSSSQDARSGNGKSAVINQALLVSTMITAIAHPILLIQNPNPLPGNGHGFR